MPSAVKASAFVVPFFLVAGAAGGFYLRKRAGHLVRLFEEALGARRALLQTSGDDLESVSGFCLIAESTLSDSSTPKVYHMQV